MSVVRYVIFLSSPSFSTFHSLTLLSPPAVASRPLPWGSKCTEYIGKLSFCHDMSKGEAFIPASHSAVLVLQCWGVTDEVRFSFQSFQLDAGSAFMEG